MGDILLLTPIWCQGRAQLRTKYPSQTLLPMGNALVIAAAEVVVLRLTALITYLLKNALHIVLESVPKTKPSTWLSRPRHRDPLLSGIACLFESNIFTSFK